jgi:flagellar hook-basal body complex protein FliE
MDAIRPDRAALGALSGALQGAGEPAASAAPGAGFGERMAGALAEANRELVGAEDAAGKFAKGEIGTLETVVAMSKADLTLRHLVTLRNRALESFQELLRLPL